MVSKLAHRRASKRILDKLRANAEQKKANDQKANHIHSLSDRFISKQTSSRGAPQAKVGAKQRFEREHTRNERSLTRATQRLRDFTAALVLVSLLSAIVSILQWWEIHNGSGDTHALATATQIAAKTSQDNFVAASRAWIGSGGATLASPPVVDQSPNVVIAYQNTGKEPAIGVIESSDVFTVPANADSIKAATFKLVDGLNKCLEIEPVVGAQVVFPSMGFAANQMTISINKNLIDKGVTDGTKFLVVTGCFAYRTLDKIHHTNFCFMYKKDMTVLPNLNFCASGSYAD